jgi:hypothetical protein
MALKGGRYNEGKKFGDEGKMALRANSSISSISLDSDKSNRKITTTE